ncbi:hypothetical protein K227x_04280 [Rubripirellula lacrimiformis]|uniref:DUF2254 domain-containing protein n=1 Tax=Rubripirellula lacrimiformis TaxID=1930273 RepID=A0A517N4J1_9BACT|nr:DUF2254 domain-containing protein [Rubripirellula lacrimiformis]QDT02057.1 hypothetical protein K227x_04280 [Rubripirellula lacrimiformis]
MNAFLTTFWATVKNSYWFIPSLMVIAAIALALGATTVDSRVGSEWMEGIDWLNANQPDGARAVLSTVAGSMITVAGVTFSMTILSISHTTSQVGPRLMNNFMGDKANQFTLGVFISTFIYCLMVLRTVRNAESGSSGDAEAADLATAFVPHIAVTVGVMLAIASVGVLIFFVHHIPESIHVSNILARVGRGLNDRIEGQFPARVGDPHEQESNRNAESMLPETFCRSAKQIRSTGTGYLEYVDGESLMRLAIEHDLLIHVRRQPGDFVSEKSLLLLVSPAEKIDESLQRSMSAMFIRGAQRTATQDLRFQINQLVEVAMRALSPGVNDPFTAICCMDWLQSALETLANRQLPDAHRFDDQQTLRVVAEPVTFDSFASLVFDQLRPYVAADRNASVQMMQMMGSLVVQVDRSVDRRLLARHACALHRECKLAMSDRRTLLQVSDCYRRILRLATDESFRQQAKECGEWTSDR